MSDTPNRKWTFKRVWWGNPHKTYLKMTFNEDPGVYTIQADAKDWLMNKIVHQYTFDRVEKTTARVQYENIETTSRVNYLQKYQDEFSEFLYFRGQAAEVRETTTLYQLLKVLNDKEKRIILKKEILELDVVTKSKDNTWKTKIRNAKNSLELLALLSQKVSDLDSVLAGFEDEILRQDITTLLDNDSSN